MKQGKLIVLEGPDGAGKTTLSEKLLKAFPQFSYQKPVPSKGPEGQNGRYMIDWMAWRFREIKKGANYLMDRINLVSEPIYGPVCRGESRLDQVPPADYVSTVSTFLGLKPIIIYCRPNNETIIDNLDKEEIQQMTGVRASIDKLLFAYDKFFKVWTDADVPFMTYDYTKDPEGLTVIDYINRGLNQ